MIRKMNLEGRLIANRYEIIENVGNGGMATVYRAKDHILNRCGSKNSKRRIYNR